MIKAFVIVTTELTHKSHNIRAYILYKQLNALWPNCYKAYLINWIFFATPSFPLWMSSSVIFQLS